MNISVLGAGSWGTALAILLGRRGCDVILWGRRSEQMLDIQQARENRQYLPGFAIPDAVEYSASLAETVSRSQVVVVAVPSTGVREIARELTALLDPYKLLIHAGKGLESDTGYRGSQIIGQEIGELAAERCVVLSGPNLSNELVRDVPSATVVASCSVESALRAQQIFHSDFLRVYRVSDVIGVELGGALKNIMAIGAGVCEGMGFGDNTKAALVTRGLKEIVRLGKALGAQQETFMGLSGIGDLMATCASKLSRNLRMGLMLGSGKTVEESLQSLGQVAEGVHTCKAAYLLGKQCGIDIPITNQLYKIIFEHKPPSQGLLELMERDFKEEHL